MWILCRTEDTTKTIGEEDLKEESVYRERRKRGSGSVRKRRKKRKRDTIFKKECKRGEVRSAGR